MKDIPTEFNDPYLNGSTCQLLGLTAFVPPSSDDPNAVGHYKAIVYTPNTNPSWRIYDDILSNNGRKVYKTIENDRGITDEEVQTLNIFCHTIIFFKKN